MIETDKKILKQADSKQTQILTPSERDKLIKDKLERARIYSEAWRKRETLSVERR